MSKQLSQNSQQQRQLKRQIANIMSSFQDAMESYANNRKQLDHTLNQLLKVYRTYRIYKSSHKIISKNSNRQDFYFEFSLLNNISCCYSTKKQTQKACQYMKLAQKQLQNILQMFQKSQLDYQTRKLQTISINMKMIKIKLQLCALHALNIQHVESLQSSSQVFCLIENVINSVCDYSMGQKFNQDFLELQKCVAEPNTQISQKQIKNTYWNNIMNCQSDQEVRNIFMTIFKTFHSKEHTQTRSCLGKIITSKQDKQQPISLQSKKYLKEFGISHIMKITPIMLDQFQRASRKEDYINLRYLHEVMILLSLTHFTVSTQLRLGTMYDTESTGIQPLSEQDVGLIKKEKRLIEAERHHFFAIEIIYKLATSYVKQCPFFNRLIKGYQEVYLLKDNFQIIPQKVDEQNQISLLSIKNKGEKYDYKEQQDYYLKKIRDSKCQTPRSQAKKQLRSNLYKMMKKAEQQQRNTRRIPSTIKSSSNYMSPKASHRIVNKSKQKDVKMVKSKNKAVEKAISPSMRRSRNQLLNMKSPNKDYSNY